MKSLHDELLNYWVPRQDMASAGVCGNVIAEVEDGVWNDVHLKIGRARVEEMLELGIRLSLRSA